MNLYEADYIEALENGFPDSVAIIKQMRVGSSKADLIAIADPTAIDFSDDAIAFEIKTERDNLRRLQKQLDDYATVFTWVEVVTYEKQAMTLDKKLPDYIGISYIDSKHEIEGLRYSSPYPDRLCPKAIFDTLSTKLALKVLKHFHIEIPDLPNTQIRSYLLPIFELLDVMLLQRAAMQELYKKTKGQVD